MRLGVNVKTFPAAITSVNLKASLCCRHLELRHGNATPFSTWSFLPVKSGWLPPF